MRFVLLVPAVFGVCLLGWSQEVLTPAVSGADLDVEHCVAYGDGKQQPGASAAALRWLLGLSKEAAAWQTPALAGETRHFRLAFRRPVTVGTICSAFRNRDQVIAVLRETATYPGRLGVDADWRLLPPGRVKTLAAGTSVRALRFTIKSHQYPWATGRRSSSMSPLLLLQGRYWDPAALGGSDWSVSGGKSRRQRSGVTDQWLGYWPRPLSIAVLAVLQGPPLTASLAALPGRVSGHPGAAEATAWQPVQAGWRTGPAAYVVKREVRALRLRAVDYCRKPTWRYGHPSVLPLVALAGDAEPPTSFMPPPPFGFRYDMPMNGFLAFRIWDEDGGEVRRLLAEVERRRGAVREGWDLQNDAGLYVKPGRYRWSAIARPPLKLTYEMTVYAAGDPPWRAQVPGGGGWMADHSPPAAICAVGDRVVMGSGGAEFGVDTIATDLAGNKLWGATHLPAVRLTADERYAYIVQNNRVIRLDPAQDFARRTLLKFKYSENLPGHARSWISSDTSGVACGKGMLYVSYRAPDPPWIRSTIAACDVDFGKCFPPPIKKRVHDTEFSPRKQILSAFQIARCTNQGKLGDATDKGNLAHTLVLALNKEVPVGSVLVPDSRITVYALKSGASLPKAFSGTAGVGDDVGLDDAEDLGLDDFGELGDRFDPKVWMAMQAGGGRHPGVAVAAKGLRTRVLAFHGPDLKRIDYAMVLDRRYRDAAPQAKLVALEGQVGKNGSWTTTRSAEDRPISIGDPPTAALVWDRPPAVRGFMITWPMARVGALVDVWTGPADAAIGPREIRDDRHWETVHRHRAGTGMVLTWHVDRTIYGDLGGVRRIRAFRFRIVEPPTGGAADGYRKKGRISGGFERFLALQPIGQDTKLPRSLAKRITAIQLDKDGTARIRGHLQAPSPTVMAIDADDTMYVALADGIAKASRISEQQDKLSYDLLIPRTQVPRARGLALDRRGHLFVAGAHSIKVFDPATGKLLRTIGRKRRLGPWEPSSFAAIADIYIDRNDKLWVVERHFQPKRIGRFDASTGRFEKDFMGPTHYGGGGFMDPGDRTVLNHLGMKFRIDYKKKTWRLEAILHPYGSEMFMPDRVVYVGNKRYLVGDGEVVTPFGDAGPIAGIYIEQQGRAMPVALAGLLGGWREVGRNPALKAAFGKLEGNQTGFVWSDRNRDGSVQFKEVQVTAGSGFRASAGIGDDLSFCFNDKAGGFVLAPQEILSNGVPIYDLKRVQKVAELTHDCMRTADGTTFVMRHKLLNAAGQVQWTYPDRYMSVQRSYQVPGGFTGRKPGQVTGGFGTIGHFKIAGEQLYCVGGNNGDYYAFTRDGLLAAAVLGGPRGYGRRYFSIPEAIPGKTDLTDLRKTVEDFHGSICRADDGKVYAIAGKNHVTVVRVDGLERMQRLGGSFEVTRKDLDATMAWAAERARLQQALQPARVYDVAWMRKPAKTDGDLITDWPDSRLLTILEVRDVTGRVSMSWQAKLAFDDKHLYIAGIGVETSPMVKSAEDPERLFQYGDALDLHLGLKTGADPKRQTAAPGDVRLLLAPVDNKMAAMLYRYRVPGFKGTPTSFKSPMGETTVDEIRQLKQARVAVRRSDRQWFLEAAIPWAALGWAPSGKSFVRRGDIGALESDPEGVSTVARHYWANKTNVVMSDLPSEAKVIPSLWGEFRFRVPDLSESLLEDDDDAGGIEGLLK